MAAKLVIGNRVDVAAMANERQDPLPTILVVILTKLKSLNEAFRIEIII